MPHFIADSRIADRPGARESGGGIEHPARIHGTDRLYR
jgi:hypothetical protein